MDEVDPETVISRLENFRVNRACGTAYDAPSIQPGRRLRSKGKGRISQWQMAVLAINLPGWIHIAFLPVLGMIVSQKIKTMRTIRSFILWGGLALIILASAAFVERDACLGIPASVNTQNKGFAVIELFTSEGCSSCPPADELVAAIAEETKDKPVYVLAYHVDYWDHQGWKDVFSNHDYTTRQQEYGRQFNLWSVYTPQIVVNGSKQFVGSEESTLRSAIRNELSVVPSDTLNLEAKQNGSDLQVSYQTTADTKNTNLLIALVQKTAQTAVKRGENAGRTLSHAQVVQVLHSHSLKSAAGEATVTIPAGFDARNWEVIGFVQHKRTGEIVAASKTSSFDIK